MKKLTWRFYTDQIFGGAFRLEGLPKDSVGTCHYQTAKKRFLAHAHVGGRYLMATGNTFQVAINRLNRELDRRSIGLFGVDVLEFELVQLGDSK